MIAEHGDAPLLQLLKQIRTVSFTIKYHREPRLQRIGIHFALMFRADWGIGLHPRNHILAQRLHQPVVDLLINVKKGLAVDSIHPIVHRRAQVQLLPWNIVSRQLCFLAVIDANVAVHIEHRFGFRPQAHPFLRQFRVPSHCQARFSTQDL